MKKLGIAVLAIAVLCLAVPTDTFAQKGVYWRGGRGWGPGTPYSRMYNSATVTTIAGEVLSVETITPYKGMSYGVHLVLKTKDGKLSVHLGPAWFVENQDTRIERGDKVEVLGSRITFDGKPAVIAAEVKKGDDVLKLRDENGFPVWSGWRRR
ncbi:MAG: DNA-binding protein [Candidatus Eisenbacteria bacterium]|nr:DNA-binding protein [Candidatus Eisenbacteria bacterium]